MMKKLNTILIISALFLSGFNAQAHSYDDDPRLTKHFSTTTPSIYKYTTPHKKPEHRLTNYGKQAEIYKKVLKLEEEVAEFERKEPESLKYRKHMNYLYGVHKYKTEKAIKELEKLRKTAGVTAEQLKNASDKFYINKYRLERTEKETKKARIDTSNTFTDSMATRKKAIKARQKFERMIKKDGDLLKRWPLTYRH